jgi:hypothetical protein
MVDKVALGQVFSEHFGFHCQSSFHQLLHSHLSSGGWYSRPIVAAVPSGLSLTQLIIIIIIIIISYILLMALGLVFAEYFGFPCQLSYHRLLHHPGLIL